MKDGGAMALSLILRYAGMEWNTRLRWKMLPRRAEVVA